jgi:hypothetical protein
MEFHLTRGELTTLAFGSIEQIGGSFTSSIAKGMTTSQWRKFEVDVAYVLLLSVTIAINTNYDSWLTISLILIFRKLGYFFDSSK